MNYKEFAIDLRKSDKEQRKMAVKLLRSLGYEVVKRKDETVIDMRYLSYRNINNRFEYYDLMRRDMKILTLPEDWGEFVNAVTPKNWAGFDEIKQIEDFDKFTNAITNVTNEMKVGDWVKVLIALSEPKKAGAVAKVKSIEGQSVYVDGFEHAWSKNAMSKNFLRLATPEEIEAAKAEAEKPVWDYPCYGVIKNIGTVVYFYAERSGIVVKQGSIREVGYHSTKWIMRVFTPCDIETILK